MTIEEAASEHLEEQFKDDEYPIGIKDIHEQCKSDFIAGALWQRGQLSWTSVQERLPKPGEEVLLYDSKSIRHYVIGWLREKKGDNKSIWCLSNGYVDNDDITHWMPIPTFDDILEANKDVLKRMKEKGD